MKKEKRVAKFVLCVRNEGCVDLEPRKIYQVISNPSAAREGCLRIIDDSGEGYLYPAEYFVAIVLPVAAAKAQQRQFAICGQLWHTGYLKGWPTEWAKAHFFVRCLCGPPGRG